MQRRVRTLWTDLNGLTHGRYIPSARFDHATHHAVTTMAMSPEGEILPLTGYAADVGFPDLAAVPLASTRRPRIGLAWSGNPANKNDHNRSIRLGSLLPLLDFDATFVSLQWAMRDADIDALKARTDLLHFGD